MKNFHLVATFFIALTLTCCTKEDASYLKDTDQEASKINKTGVITRELLQSHINGSIINYKETGVNFYVEKDNSFSTRYAANNASEAQLILKTELADSEVVETMLLYKFEENGNVVITHYLEDQVFATLYLNSEGEIFKIDLSNDGISTRSIKSWYKCVNDKYQENKRIIESDMLNDITCTVLAVPCVILNAASAIKKC